MTRLQDNLLARGPFDVTFRELAILGECLGFYRFEPRGPFGPVAINTVI